MKTKEEISGAEIAELYREIAELKKQIEQAQSRWIPCSERLPEGGATVDVIVENEFGKFRLPNVTYKLKDAWKTSDRFENYQHGDNGMEWVDITNTVTHWTTLPPLPDSPKL
jgi:hypothetical protein